MAIFTKSLLSFFSSILQGLKDDKFRGLFIFVLVILLIGTLFYHKIENWSWVDSFYFSSISLTTVGYGDLAPKTDLGKLFTVFYIFSGIGIIFGFINSVANKAHENNENLLNIRNKNESEQVKYNK